MGILKNKSVAEQIRVDIQTFLDSLDLHSIGTQQNEHITTKITIDEIQRAIEKLKPNKAPGNDGCTAEWYKKLGED